MIEKVYKLFDSNCHPTTGGTWLDKHNNNYFDNLMKSINKNNLLGALAVGLADMDNYSHKDFINSSLKYPSLIPIAGVNPLIDNSFHHFYNLKKIGFFGIKIHPRFSRINLIDKKEQIIKIIKICGDLGLVVLFCTYFEERGKLIIDSPLEYLKELVNKCHETQIILMHSGYNQFNNYLHSLGDNENVIFDFSYTIMTIKSQNMGKDIKTVFTDFSSKICIGSDWPEYSQEELIKIIPSFCNRLSQEKINDICNKNILRVFNESK